MSANTRGIPAGSQTVGPFFRIGMEYLTDRIAMADAEAEGLVEIRGKVLDGAGAPVPDALLEFWNGTNSTEASVPQEHGNPDGFRRAATDLNGAFTVRIVRPVGSPLEDGREQAPHWMVLVFARGLLRHLITRVYIEDENANERDAVLLGVPAERRGTLIAKRDESNAYRWDVILQGPDETVFFAW